MSDAEIDRDPIARVQPPLHTVRRGRENDLIKGLVVQRLFDGVHRIVSDRYNALHGMTGGLLDERKHPFEQTLSFHHLVVALGMSGVPLSRSRVRNEDAELSGPARRAPPDRVEQGRRSGGPIGDH
jgi:hypothetical protein